jgi:hypothetical protein
LPLSGSSRFPSLSCGVYSIHTPRLYRTYYRVYFSSPFYSLLPVALYVTVFPLIFFSCPWVFRTEARVQFLVLLFYWGFATISQVCNFIRKLAIAFL